jgi:hypothetical protein
MQSVFFDNGMTASGSLEASANGGVPSDWSAQASAQFQAQFTLDSDSPYASAFSHSIELNSTFQFYNDEGMHFAPSSIGILPAGAYTVFFNVSVVSPIGGEPRFGPYSYVLAIGVPEPGTASLAGLALGCFIAIRRRA